MIRIVAGAAILLFLTSGQASAGYEDLAWRAPYRVVKRSFPGISRVRDLCYFEGVNLFGQDSLVVFEEKQPLDGVRRRLFVFQQGKLVAVEIQYDNSAVTDSLFQYSIIEPLVQKYGKKKMKYKQERNRTKENKYFIWDQKDDIIVAVYGHFKKVSPDNLDWVRVKYYDKDYYYQCGTGDQRASKRAGGRIYF